MWSIAIRVGASTESPCLCLEEWCFLLSFLLLGRQAKLNQTNSTKCSQSICNVYTHRTGTRIHAYTTVTIYIHTHYSICTHSGRMTIVLLLKRQVIATICVCVYMYVFVWDIAWLCMHNMYIYNYIYYVYAYGHPWTTLTLHCFQHVHCVTFICFSSACKTTTRRDTKKMLETTRKNKIAQLLAGHPIDTKTKTSKNHEKVIRKTPENKQNGCNLVCQTWAFLTISRTLCVRGYCKWCPFGTVFICRTIVAWFGIFEAPQT